MTGVYQIVCVPNGKSYIGSALNIEARWADHRNRLLGGKHKNQHLQNCWRKYGAQAFKFIVLEQCAESELRTAEQFWLTNTPNLMNMVTLARGGIHATGWTAEMRKKQSETVRRMAQQGLWTNGSQSRYGTGTNKQGRYARI